MNDNHQNTNRIDADTFNAIADAMYPEGAANNISTALNVTRQIYYYWCKNGIKGDAAQAFRELAEQEITRLRARARFIDKFTTS